MYFLWLLPVSFPTFFQQNTHKGAPLRWRSRDSFAATKRSESRTSPDRTREFWNVLYLGEVWWDCERDAFPLLLISRVWAPIAQTKSLLEKRAFRWKKKEKDLSVGSVSVISASDPAETPAWYASPFLRRREMSSLGLFPPRSPSLHPAIHPWFRETRSKWFPRISSASFFFFLLGSPLLHRTETEFSCWRRNEGPPPACKRKRQQSLDQFSSGKNQEVFVWGRTDVWNGTLATQKLSRSIDYRFHPMVVCFGGSFTHLFLR